MPRANSGPRRGGRACRRRSGPKWNRASLPLAPPLAEQGSSGPRGEGRSLPPSREFESAPRRRALPSRGVLCRSYLVRSFAIVAPAARPDGRKELVIGKKGFLRKPVSVLPSAATAHFLDGTAERSESRWCNGKASRTRKSKANGGEEFLVVKRFDKEGCRPCRQRGRANQCVVFSG